MLAKIEQVGAGVAKAFIRILIATTGLWGCSSLVTGQHPQIMELTFVACLAVTLAIHALAWMVKDMVREDKRIN